MDWLGADANAVVVTLEWDFFVAAAGQEFGVDAELLRPIARDAAADGQQAHFLRREHCGGVMFEIFEGIEA